MAQNRAKSPSGNPSPAELYRLEAMLARGEVAAASREAASLASVHSRSAALQLLLGAAKLQMHEYEAAAQALARATQIDAKSVAAWCNLGTALKELARREDARRALERAIRLKPNFAPAHFNLGNLLREDGQFAAAILHYRKAIATRPDNAVFHFNMGLAFYMMGDFESAIEAQAEALRCDPAYASAHAALGNTLLHLDRLEETRDAYRRALELEPENAIFHFNMGRTLRDLGDFEAAETSYRQAIRLDPSLESPHMNLGLLQLLRGDFDTGFREYEWRKAKPDYLNDKYFSAKPWLGEEDLYGKTILIHSEQGLGDTIQFLRYVELVHKLGAEIQLAVQPGLIPLVRRSCTSVEVVPNLDPLPRTDYHIHLLSLPLAFGTTPETIPASVPYIVPDPERVGLWRKRLDDSSFRIGICWQGSTQGIDKGRSFPLSSFSGIARMKGTRLISLHKGAGEAQLETLAGWNVETLSADFDPLGHSFEDTAAVMMHCDLIISSDTAIAHLAGALGRPVWVALCHLPDWRWMLDRADSPWYPTMRLFRQKYAGDWRSAFAEIEAALADLRPADRLLTLSQPRQT